MTHPRGDLFMVSFDYPQNLPERVEATDRLLGKILLILELFEIPEFRRLWGKAFEKQYRVVEGIIACHQAALNQISPEGREAFTRQAVVQIQAPEGRTVFAITESGAEVLSSYGPKAFYEALVVTKALNEATKQLEQSIGDQIDDMGSASYRVALENLVGPLGVPNLALIIMALDWKVWGWYERLANVYPMDRSLREGGWLREQLEAAVLKGLTDLSPAQLAKESPGRIRRRMERKVAPLMRRYFRGGEPFDVLRQRIHLWIRNKVYGETLTEIARDLQSDESRRATGVSPQSWVEQQIGEATHILGAKVSSGRPRKGGVLRRWERVPQL
jgi:hypothetical protein